MAESDNENLWIVFDAIINKDDFFTKMYDETIVEKWREETRAKFPGMSDNDFTLIINLVRCSFQGAEHLDTCEWEDDGPCDECIEKLREDVRANPQKYGLNEEDVHDALEDFYADNMDNCGHPRCTCKPPDYQLDKYIKYFGSKFLPDELHAKLGDLINDLKTRTPVDLHPGSDGRVRDLVHPSMYCYLRPREPEETRYQWLPAEFAIANGKTQILSYINNLDNNEFPDAIPILESVFDHFIEPLSAVLKTDISNSPLQVIVKIASATLTPENPISPDGSWHIEGMPYEHIAATCLYYSRIRNISPSALKFRKLTPANHMWSYPQYASSFTEHHYGIKPGTHSEGVMNRTIGFVMAHEGAAVVFPNTLQHKVRNYKLDVTGDGHQDTSDSNNENIGERTILAFFVVDPKYPIPSTGGIPPQQYRMTHETAEKNRLELMKYRGKFITDMNNNVFERDFALCEH